MTTTEAGFQADLRKLLAERGWSPRRASAEAGLSGTRVWAYLGGKFTPTTESLRRIARALDVTPDMLAAWEEELAAVTAASPHRQAAEKREARREVQIKDRAAVPCRTCRRDFVPTTDEQQYCSRDCTGGRRATFRQDTKLKVRFHRELLARNLTRSQAARQMGLTPDAVMQWLQRDNGYLARPALEKMAEWLGIPIGDAIELQGGTAEDRKRRQAAAAAASPKRQKWVKELRTKHAAKARVRDATLAGQERQAVEDEDGQAEAQRRAKISTAKATYHQEHPETVQRLVAFNKTFRTRALRIVAGLKARHPDWAAERIHEAAIRRLLEPPYSVGYEFVARMLLTPRQQTERTGGGRPANHERFAVIQSVRNQWPKLANGQPAPGLRMEIVRSVLTNEGQAIPSEPTDLEQWSRTLRGFEIDYRDGVLKRAGVLAS